MSLETQLSVWNKIDNVKIIFYNNNNKKWQQQPGLEMEIE